MEVEVVGATGGDNWKLSFQLSDIPSYQRENQFQQYDLQFHFFFEVK